MLDWHGTGVSVMEMNKRDAEFKAITTNAKESLR